MAKPISEKTCIDRHKDYPFDIDEKDLRADNLIQTLRLKEMFSLVSNKKGVKVLDIGCNSGYIINYLDKCSCYGCDVSEELVEKAKQRINAVVAKAEKLPYPDDFFDVAVLGEIIEHVFDPVKVMDEAVRVSKKMVVGSTPHEKGLWGNFKDHKHHVRCYTKETLIEFLSKYGTPTVKELHAKGRRQMYIFKVDLK